MTPSFAEIFDTTVKAKATRQAFGEELKAVGAKDPNVVALDADLSKSTKTDLFAGEFPQRFFEMGIAEANMIGVAAGLARAGKTVFAASFGCFLTGRFDQIRMSVSFTRAKVRLVGTHAGVGIGEDGHSQMGLEDLALMRVLPNMTVFQPADEWETKEFVRWSLSHPGPCYLRLTRQDMPSIRRASPRFAPGRWELLTKDLPASNGIVLLASGGLLPPAAQALPLLQEKFGARVALVNANWIQPIDGELLSQVARGKPQLIVTLEDHYTVGGLGGAVAEYLAERGTGARLLRIGVEGFGQSGSPQANYEHYGFTPQAIADRIARSLG